MPEALVLGIKRARAFFSSYFFLPVPKFSMWNRHAVYHCIVQGRQLRALEKPACRVQYMQWLWWSPLQVATLKQTMPDDCIFLAQCSMHILPSSDVTKNGDCVSFWQQCCVHNLSGRENWWCNTWKVLLSKMVTVFPSDSSAVCAICPEEKIDDVTPGRCCYQKCVWTTWWRVILVHLNKSV